MIFELFVLGGVAFWILSGAMFLLLLWAASDDRAVASGLLLAGYLAAIYLFGNAGTLPVPEAWVFYIGIPAYLVVGTLWGIGKWYLYVSRQVMSYKEHRQEFLINSGIAHAAVDMIVPARLKAHWRRAGGRRLRGRPVARQNKRRIISWMCFWPTSMVWAVIDEPWRRIYNAISALLQRIADSIYERAGVDADLSKPTTLKEALDEELAGCGADEGDWDVEIIVEALIRAAHQMEIRYLMVRAVEDGGSVRVTVPPNQPLPHLPASVMGIEIEVVSVEIDKGTSVELPGDPTGYRGRSAK